MAHPPVIESKFSAGHLLFLVLCALLLCSCQKTPKIAPLGNDAVILAFGDSLTYGTGAGREESYPAILASLTGHKVINAGVPGEVSEEGRARLATFLDETQPSLLLLCHGGNDFLRRLDPGQVKVNLRAMVQSAKERGISVVLIAVPTLGFGLQVPPLYEELAREEDLPVEGEILSEILGDAKLKSDPIHPNAAGYKQLAVALESLLRRSEAL
ncbi:MAG: arylesterase [Deltaproteobacteria bacterium HGW-Deltaproteobacteria-4]|nr:MAG: arylesterase [Deltaproteobacteria bacterium HGW-Deltaproteobacteria-4]